ncbi:Bifunctional purine biosynthesis protein PurH [Caulifigura coniformis]|uniref:Bifunctional purine biosynthesis protein PurH n=1 Tax=Caulifigura coniformis TaxID=2527983 RepID=A0A517SKM1_9PLAN|nr:bifunctional phosphoribosylaminoimidazolecarboxamide formyltransferase/IMP cyclohydrolase [Caulifigura coniformis]QDT56673.1 Bifunctional purine biosynthesis protein PurH [Caulifigura coniformis]
MARRALISVSDKTGLGPFVKGLVDLEFEILSTGGTAKFLRDQGVKVIDVAEYTGFPEMMDGRVKTLHPRIHGGILGRPDLAEDAASMKEHGILPFELIVVNLYPFEQTVAKPNVKYEEAVEQIDIGGPSMVRSAAKNHAYVGIVTRADQYDEVLAALRAGQLSLQQRRRLMQAAFEMTARYDAAIAAHFLKEVQGSAAAAPPASAGLPQQLDLKFERRQELRYGENPHQKAAWYVEPSFGPTTVSAAQQVHGKELSYNNLLDLDAAVSIVREFKEPAATVIKHNNPCGCGIGATLAEAFDKAYEGDPISAFGSIIGLNRVVDAATVEQLCAPNRFIEAIIAPGFEPEAITALTTRPKWKNSVRLLELPQLMSAQAVSWEYRRIAGGLLVQERDELPEDETTWKVVTQRQPSEHERRDLAFAWKVCKHVKSNAILLAKAGMVVGVGAGQMSRVDSSWIAAHKAGSRSKGAVAASDAFFPFRDGVDQASQAGVTALIQPGGSVRDEEVIAACNELGLAMIFTGRRHFKH